MSTVLHLGVVDVPYDHREPLTTGQIFEMLKRGKRVTRSAVRGSPTTGDVAEILEAKYHVMEIFFELHQKDILDAIGQSLVDRIDQLGMGAPIDADAFGDATAEIYKLFQRFIDSKEMDALGIPGVPTKASLKGVSHRFKRKKGPPRPSFQDTGTYETDFASWVD